MEPIRSERLVPFKSEVKADGCAVLTLSFIVCVLQVLAQNSGYDPQETLVKLQTEFKEAGQPVGVDLSTGVSRD